MYVVHSRAITRTPKALAELLGARPIPAGQIRRNVVSMLDFRRDFFTIYPAALDRALGPEYASVGRFTRLNKLEQRQALRAAGLPAVQSYGPGELLPPGDWLFRTLRHRARQNFCREQTIAAEVVPTGEYAAPWLDIRKEFRTVFVRGMPLYTMFKPALPSAQPWSFTRLDRLDLLEQLAAFAPIRHASICGVDLGLARDPEQTVIFELNFAPALGPENLERVVQALRGDTCR